MVCLVIAALDLFHSADGQLFPPAEWDRNAAILARGRYVVTRLKTGKVMSYLKYSAALVRPG
jgi:hypothetical protein